MGETANRYLTAAGRIPRGETRSFLELAAMAARSGAARSAARAVRACPADSRAPWHRVVAADGALDRDSMRAALQLQRLRREGARPRSGERVAAWAKRVGAAAVGRLPERWMAVPEDPRAARWGPLSVEPLFDLDAARARGFVPIDEERVEAPPVAVPDETPRGGDTAPLAERVAALDWAEIEERLVGTGLHHAPGLLSAAECAALLAAGAREEHVERTVVMRPLGYGLGTYHYLHEPPPEPLAGLRGALYPRLVGAAERLWSARPVSGAFPPTLEEFQRACRAAGQQRGSCILLRYGAGGVNHPHRDLFGKVAFPLQALVVLSQRGRDFEGGAFCLHEERGPAALETRAVAADRGDLVLFASSHRWDRSGRRPRKVPLLHGMQPVTRGARFAAGVVFHLAR